MRHAMLHKPARHCSGGRTVLPLHSKLPAIAPVNAAYLVRGRCSWAAKETLPWIKTVENCRWHQMFAAAQSSQPPKTHGPHHSLRHDLERCCQTRATGRALQRRQCLQQCSQGLATEHATWWKDTRRHTALLAWLCAVCAVTVSLPHYVHPWECRPHRRWSSAHSACAQTCA